MLFDTLRFAKRLEAAGVSKEYAEAATEDLAEALMDSLQKLITREELQLLIECFEAKFEAQQREREHLTKELSALETRFNAKLEKLTLRMIIVLGSLALAGPSAMNMIFRLFSQYYS